ncbi:MAG: hypothetical protein ABWX96_18450 [Propionibacteriaceae bacterium]
MSASNENGLGLFDDAASAAGNFPSALRGYDRSAVDEYVRSLEGAVVQTRRQASDLDAQLNQVRVELDEANKKLESPDVDYTNLGGRASDILRLAEEQAREVLDRASEDAEKLKETARREADQARDEAVKAGGDIKSSGIAEIEQLRTRGQDDVRQQVDKAKAEAEAIVAAARRQAEALQREADHEAQTLRQNAYLDTETLRRTVEREVAEIRQDIAGEREAAIGHLKGVHEESVTKTSALLTEATEYHRQAAERLEADIAEAARIRTEALAEAEQVKLKASQEAEDRIVAARKQAAAITDRTQQEFAWRKQQLRRETDLLSQRKQAVLNQLASLSALAEQTAHAFPDMEDLDDFDGEQGDRTVMMPASAAPSLPQPSSAAAQPVSDQTVSDETVSQEPASDEPALEEPPLEDDSTILVAEAETPTVGSASPSADDGSDDDETSEIDASDETSDESGTETRLLEAVTDDDITAEADRKARDNGTEDTMEIDGDATVMVPASQLPAGTSHLHNGPRSS